MKRKINNAPSLILLGQQIRVIVGHAKWKLNQTILKQANKKESNWNVRRDLLANLCR